MSIVCVSRCIFIELHIPPLPSMLVFPRVIRYLPLGCVFALFYLQQPRSSLIPACNQRDILPAVFFSSSIQILSLYACGLITAQTHAPLFFQTTTPEHLKTLSSHDFASNRPFSYYFLIVSLPLHHTFTLAHYAPCHMLG
jgi:hypothetical protein